MFAYHYCNKKEEDYWKRFGSHMGTLWDRDELRRLISTPSGPPGQNQRVFVPLALVVNPDLPNALLGIKKGDKPSTSDALPQGDGLNTGMPIPLGDEVENMAELPKDEFLQIISRSGLAGSGTPQ